MRDPWSSCHAWIEVDVRVHHMDTRIEVLGMSTSAIESVRYVYVLEHLNPLHVCIISKQHVVVMDIILL